MKKYKNYIIAFIMPIVILLLILLLNGYYPFGDNNILMLDGYNQYPGFLSLYIDILKGKANLFYTFNGSLGLNLFPNIVYYLLNPTNLIAIFFNNTNLRLFYLITILLRFGLMSITTLKLLNYYKKTSFNIFFAICFSLSSYNLLYYSNYMWFDSIILFPLIILGIHKIIDKNNYLLYSITLTLAIISNFYIGYMICLFSVLYFTYLYILTKNKNKKQILNFFITSILSGLIASVFLYPTIIELLNGKAELFTRAATNYFEFDLDFINIFYKTTIASFINGDLEFGNPNIYISIFVIINVFLFFFNKKIKAKEKICTLIMILFFLLSVSFNLLDYGFQMFQSPIFYPVRYAFIIDLFLLIIAAKNYYKMEVTTKGFIITTVIYIVLILIGFYTSGNYEDLANIKTKYIYLGISILIIFYYIFMLKNKDFKKYIFIIILIETISNTFITFKNFSKDLKVSDYEEKFNLNYNALEKLNTDNNRISTSIPVITNNSLLLNYKGISYFSSIRNKKVFELFKNLGISVHDSCSVRYAFNNPLINNLFGIKYYITNTPIDYYKKTNDLVYENQDNASLTYIFNKDIADISLEKNPIINMNKLMKYFTNIDDSFEEYKQTNSTIHCSDNFCTYISVENQKDYIQWKFTPKSKSFIIINTTEVISKLNYEIKINDNLITNSYNTPILVNKNDKIEITLEFEEIDKETFTTECFKVYSLDYDAYQLFNKQLNSQAKILEFKDNYIKLEVENAQNNKVLFTSFTNDNGWKAKINKKEVEITPIFDSLIGLPLENGNNIIELEYHTPGLKTGLIITITSLIVQTCYQIYLKNRYYQK